MTVRWFGISYKLKLRNIGWICLNYGTYWNVLKNLLRSIIIAIIQGKFEDAQEKIKKLKELIDGGSNHS